LNQKVVHEKVSYEFFQLCKHINKHKFISSSPSRENRNNFITSNETSYKILDSTRKLNFIWNIYLKNVLSKVKNI